MGMKRITGAVLCLFLALSFSNGFAFGLGKNKFEQELEKEAGAIKLARETVQGGYRLVSSEELKALIDRSEDMLIIDTMPYEESYKKNHLPGAEQFLFPIPDMENWDTAETDGKSREDYELLLGPDKDRMIVVYCGFVKCTRSHNGALWAAKMGYTNVYRYPGGIFAWKGAEYPVESVEQ